MLLAFVFACSTLGEAPPPSPPLPPIAEVPAPPAPVRPAPPADTPVACKADADCPSLACGPCNAGDKVTEMVAHIQCFRNPCPGQVAICSPDHVCVARDTIPMTTR